MQFRIDNSYLSIYLECHHRVRSLLVSLLTKEKSVRVLRTGKTVHSRYYIHYVLEVVTV